jgi:hypothetical protein
LLVILRAICNLSQGRHVRHRSSEVPGRALWPCGKEVRETLRRLADCPRCDVCAEDHAGYQCHEVNGFDVPGFKYDGNLGQPYAVFDTSIELSNKRWVAELEGEIECSSPMIFALCLGQEKGTSLDEKRCSEAKKVQPGMRNHYLATPPV